MTSRELITETERLLSLLDKEAYLMKTLSNFAVGFGKVKEAQDKLVNQTDASTIVNLQRNTEAVIQQELKECKSLRPRILFKEVENLESEIGRLRSQFSKKQCGTFDQILHLLAKFSDKYEELINSHNKMNCAELLSISAQLYSAAKATDATLHLIASELKISTKQGLTPDSILSIFVPGFDNFESFVNRIQSINLLNDEVGELLRIPASDRKLEIIKIESGSAWVEIAGNPEVISFIIGVITTTAGYIYRTRSKEGGVAQLPRNVEALESVLNIRDKLRERDIDTEAIDENIKKSAQSISNQMNKLFAGADELELNGKTLPLSERSNQEQLGGRAHYLMDEQTETKHPDDET